MATTERIADLIIKHLKGGLSAAERQELEQWMEMSASHRRAAEVFLSEEPLKAGIKEYWVEDHIWSRLDQLIQPAIRKPASLGFRIIGWSVAAAVFLLVGLVYLLRPGQKQPALPPAVVAKQDVPAPNRARAVITLASGQQIEIDSAGMGTLARQGQVKVVKLADGELAYTGQDDQVFFNTLYNPRGSRAITLTLPDGTRVWLNAASSLRYPTAFKSSTRTVDITGEGYFEVAKDAARPFVVRKGSMEVTVLGTSFNVNGYDDEPSMLITLIDGSVKVAEEPLVGVNTNKEKLSVVLKPGQQAKLVARENTGNGKDQIKIMSDADQEAVLAWKNGRFAFSGVGIQEVMRSVARWYDVQIEYQGTPTTQHFRGGISRFSDVSEVLKMLETTGIVHFSIQNKKIIVMP